MGFPTLLVRGNLAGRAAELAAEDPKDPRPVPVEYILAWLRRRMPELGGKPSGGAADRVLIVRSKTGSGKSTALPVHVFRLLRGEKAETRLQGGEVICTQPRVLTAQTLARDIGASPHYPDMVLGETVGYQTGPLNERPARGLIYATAGVLLAQLRVMSDGELLRRYRFVIVDEAHERSHDIDSLLMRLKRFLARNAADPRCPFVLLASATLPVEKYARYFGVGRDNVIEVAGRQYGVASHFPAVGTNDYVTAAAAAALRIHNELGAADAPDQADILVFMPGDAEMKAAVGLLAEGNAAAFAAGRPFLVLKINRPVIQAEGRDYRILKIPGSRLTVPDPEGRLVPVARRIIVATVVAETGLTIETLKYVVDCGWSRGAETYYPWGIRGLITRPAPQSRIHQRMGRAGREFPGEFYPLYTRNVHDALEVDQAPEVFSAGVEPIFLDIVANTGDRPPPGSPAAAAPPPFRVEDIDMLDPPPADALQKALEVALLLGFVEEVEGGHAITPRGEVAGRFQTASMSEIALMLSAPAGVAARDLVTLASLAGLGRSTIERDVYATRRGPPLYDPATWAPAGAQQPGVQDDFLEGLDIVDGVIAALGRGFASLVEFADGREYQLSGLSVLAGRREKLAEEAVAAGVDLLANDELRVAAAATPEERCRRVRALRRCLVSAFPGNVVSRADLNSPFTYMGIRVATYGNFASSLRLLTSQPMLVRVRPKRAEKVARLEYNLVLSLACPIEDTPADEGLFAPEPRGEIIRDDNRDPRTRLSAYQAVLESAKP